jgi:hypothetical protein
MQHLATIGFTGLFRDQSLFDLLLGFRPPLIKLGFGQERWGSNHHRRRCRTTSQNQG